jgi:hypothetical protein
MSYGPAPTRRLLLRLLSAGVLALGIVTFLASLTWRGARFPGFLVMPNRVVPSAGLPGWSGVSEGRPPYQEVLLAVDDARVTSADEAYRRAAAHQVGETARYTFVRDGVVETQTYPLRRLTDSEYFAIFGTYFIAGLAHLLLAWCAGERWGGGSMYRGLAMFGWAGATFAFTAMDLYGPGRLFRLHALAEVGLSAAAFHLALVCPRDRVTGRPGILVLAYGFALALATVYQLFLHDPHAYSIVHNFAQGVGSVPVLAFTALVALSVTNPPTALGSEGVRRLLLGVLLGLIAPALLFGLSAATGGSLPVNAAAWVGFAFPLGAIAALRAAPRATVAARRWS